MDNAYLTDPSQADYCLLVDISYSVGACRQGSACHDTPGSWLLNDFISLFLSIV